MTAELPVVADAAQAGQGSVPTQAQLLELAAVISRDTEVRTLVVDEAGRKVPDGWMAIEEAVSSGRSFMVTPRPTILAVDADSQAQIEALGLLADAIGRYGFEPLVVPSGRGHHLFVRMPICWVAEWSRRARDAGLDVRAGTPIRPPLSPHPAGLSVGLVDLTVDQAIAALTTDGGPGPRLSRKMWRLLTSGVGSENYRSGSEKVQAVATACHNVGVSRGWFMAALTDEANDLSAVAGSRRDPGAWLARSWDAASKFVRSKPLRHGVADFMAAADAIEVLYEAGFLSSMLAAVLSGHLRAGRERGSVVHRLSIDQCVIDAGASRSTVISSRKVLRAMGLLEQDDEMIGGGNQAGVWRLGVPVLIALAKVVVPLGCPPRSWQGRRPSLCATDFGHDAHRWGALGKRAPAVLALFAETGAPMSAPMLAALLPGAPCVGTVRRLLRRMADAGIVARSSKGWELVDDSSQALQRAAEIAGTDGRRKAEIERVERARQERCRQRANYAAGVSSGPPGRRPPKYDHRPPPRHGMTSPTPSPHHHITRVCTADHLPATSAASRGTATRPPPDG